MYDVVVNYWAILVSGIAFMAIGYLWYGPLFGARWLAAMDKKKEELNQSMMPMVWSFVAALVTSFVLAHMIQIAVSSSYADAFATSFWLWLGFVAASTVTNSLFESVPATRVWLFVAYQFIAIMAATAILYAWK